VLNNAVHKDNRIPPRGFTNAAFAAFGGPPVGYAYADGQYWDDTYYSIPLETAAVQVTLYYQSTSKEFVEFVRDTNTTNTKGQEIYNLWANNGKCPPEPMVQVQLPIAPPPPGDINLDGYVNWLDYELFAGCLVGPEVPYGTGCERSNLDVDADCDLLDMAEFQAGFTG